MTCTLRIISQRKPVIVEMPCATTIRYAALRMVEALGLDPEGATYHLVNTRTRRVIPGDDLVAAHDGQEVHLAVERL